MEQTYVLPGKNTGKKDNNPFYVLIVMLLFFNFFNTGSGLISVIIGTISYTMTFLVIYLVHLGNIGSIRLKTAFLFIISSLGFMFLIINRGDSFDRVLTSLIQISVIILIVTVSSKFYINNSFINNYKKIHPILIIILYSLTVLRMLGNVILFKNINSLSEMSALFFIFNAGLYYYSARRLGIYHVLSYLPLLIISNGRTMQLCLVIFLLVFVLWNKIVKNYFRRILTFSIVTSIIYVISTKYPSWYYNSEMVSLNHLVREWTGKNFFSGRQIIWQNIFNIMEGHEWFGYGTGTLYSQIVGEYLSAHNQYLQLYMQNGLIGVISLFVVLFSVWMSLSISMNTEAGKLKRISGSLLLAFMITNIFNVSMLQNAMYSSLTAWFIIGMGLKKANVGSERKPL